MYRELENLKSTRITCGHVGGSPHFIFFYTVFRFKTSRFKKIKIGSFFLLTCSLIYVRWISHVCDEILEILWSADVSGTYFILQSTGSTLRDFSCWKWSGSMWFLRNFEWLSCLWCLKCSIKLLILSVKTAIWTSAEPVSLSFIENLLIKFFFTWNGIDSHKVVLISV